MPDRQRHIRLRRLLTAVVGALAVAVVGAGLAWACTPQADIFPLDHKKGPPGTSLTVWGKGFVKRGDVRVFLVSADGHKRHLVTSRADRFGDYNYDVGPPPALAPRAAKKGNVEIPEDVAPGLYTVIAHGYENGKLASREADQNSDTFLVTPPARVKDTPDTGNAPPPRGPASPPDRDPIREPSGRGAGAGGSPATAGSASNDRPTTGRSGSAGTERTRAAGDPSHNGGARSEGSGHPDLVTAPSGQSVFRDSLTSPALTDDGRRPFGQPSGRSAAGDLWSGYGSGRMPSLEPRRGDPPAEDAGGFDIGMAAGTGFLGLGLVALFGSFLVAEVRRRRKAVRA